MRDAALLGGGGRAAGYRTCCIPCVYARAYENQHPHFEQAGCTCTEPEMPQTVMGQYACCCMSCTQAGDAMVPFLSAYEATHNQSSARHTCGYFVVGALPCLYCQPCQIAAEPQGAVTVAVFFAIREPRRPRARPLPSSRGTQCTGEGAHFAPAEAARRAWPNA